MTKTGLAMRSLACAANIARPLGTMSRKLAALQGSTCAREALHRRSLPDAEQAEIEDRDRAEEERDAEDVHEHDGGVEPQRIAHRLREGRGFERRHRAHLRASHALLDPDLTDCSAPGSPAGSVPPACAMSGRPPPLPPTCCAT